MAPRRPLKRQADLAAQALLLPGLNAAWDAYTRVRVSFKYAFEIPINTPAKSLSVSEGISLARLVFFSEKLKRRYRVESALKQLSHRGPSGCPCVPSGGAAVETARIF